MLFLVFFSIFFVFATEQKCQDRGQKLKFDSIDVWKIVSLLNLQRFLPILFKILSCWTAFLHMVLIWLSKLSIKSISTPKSLTLSSQVISTSPILSRLQSFKVYPYTEHQQRKAIYIYWETFIICLCLCVVCTVSCAQCCPFLCVITSVFPNSYYNLWHFKVNMTCYDNRGSIWMLLLRLSRWYFIGIIKLWKSSPHYMT